ncbi:MAG: hypothetical protein E7373_06750 [Clostridiales bacterium]|nr:hypothetical protein [Clostridiales bacterium]
MMGIPLMGYYQVRIADGVLDDLEANAIAYQLGEMKTLMISVDHCGLKQEILNQYREKIAVITGLTIDNIFVSATHTHTGPETIFDSDNEKVREYAKILQTKLVDVACWALADLKPAKMGWGIGQAPNVAFIRRFRMKDGSVKTNPGVNNPNIVAPIGEVDERVSVVRFDRECADSVVLVNFANHPDVVGGLKISADWPGLLRKNVEKAIDNVKCIFFNGVQGDVNHVNVHPTGGYLNDMFVDFDDVARGYGHANYIARVVLGGVLQAFDKVQYVNVNKIESKIVKIAVQTNKANKEELLMAHKINDLYVAGRANELPYEGMMLTTVVAEAARMVRLENQPKTYEMLLSGMRIGPIVFVGIPGEPFTNVGRELKETTEFELIIPMCNTNGKEGYFPMQDSYDEGGYEARTSTFKAGTAEFIIAEGKRLIKELAK